MDTEMHFNSLSLCQRYLNLLKILPQNIVNLTTAWADLMCTFLELTQRTASHHGPSCIYYSAFV